MALRVWLPLDGDLRNQGISDLSTPSNNTLTLQNNGKIGKCYSGQAVWHLTNELLENKWSVCAWIKADGWYSANNLILCKNINTGDAYQIYFSIIGGTQIRLGINNSSGITFNYTFNTGTWYHVAASYDGSKGNIYINGILQTSAAVSNTFVSGMNNIGINCRASNVNGTSRWIGDNSVHYINDVRIYDHCLSAAEVKEIAQGLILHYKLDDEYIESTTNYAPSPYSTTYNNATYAWDTTKHPNAIVPAGWSGGYNGGVSNPSTGYHAMWNLIDNIPTIVFQNHNSIINSTNRWLGVASATLSILIPPTVKYTISYEQKTLDTLGGYTTGGIYYKYNSSSSTTFHDGCPKIGQNTKLNVWEKFSYTFTRNSNVDSTATNGTIYIYGSYGTESTMLVRNVQLELNDHATPYAVSNRLSNNINIASNNLITGLTAGGHTTVANNVVTTAGTDADTYFYINLSSAMIKNHLYKLSCDVGGLAAGGYWNFPIASQSNTSIPTFYLRNGHNEVIFRANDTCVTAGTKVILDDNGATSRTVVMTARNFQLYDITPIVYDSSGYSHNGTLIGEFTIKDSQRYNKCLYCNSSAPTTDAEQGISYIQSALNLTTPLQLSFTWWAKPESGYGGSSSHAAFCTSNQTVSPTDYNTTAFHHRDSGFDIYPSDGSGVKRLSFSYTKNEWHHYAVTYDGTIARTYQDGVLKTSIEVGANKTLASFSQLYIGFSKAGNVWRKTLGSYSDFRVYVTQLLDTDIKQLYNVGMKIDKLGSAHSFEFIEQQSNMIFPIELSRSNLEFTNGLSRYTQSNCQVTLTDQGYHIYRPPNLTTANNGNTMWGGLKLVNQKTDTIAAYDNNRDNNWGLQKGHTYFAAFHAKGKSSNSTSWGWGNNMGWSGGGVDASPTIITNIGIPSDFQGEKDCIFIFTINDDIAKNCTSAYSSYVTNTTYLSYRHLTFGWGYSSTGALGTDLYLTDLRLYDITNYMAKITKQGQAKFYDFVEQLNKAQIRRNSEFLSSNFIER